MTWSRACRICYAANHPQPCCAAQAATEAAGAISAPHAGIGIGGTNLSSLCATGIANGAKKPDAGGGTGGAARAWPDNAASASKQRQNLMARNAITPTISAPARDDMAAPLLAIVTIYGAI